MAEYSRFGFFGSGFFNDFDYRQKTYSRRTEKVFPSLTATAENNKKGGLGTAFFFASDLIFFLFEELKNAFRTPYFYVFP